VRDTGAKAEQVITAVPGPAVIGSKVILRDRRARRSRLPSRGRGEPLDPDSLDNVALDYQVID